jgi:UDP-N-acetylmuramoyl-tripeptide--D-alanyl-D-alanine ligase
VSESLERAPLWTAAEIAAATGGRVEGPPFDVYGVSIDSRDITPGDLFVALAGERDGHDFAEGAMAKGAAASLVSRTIGGPDILVDDTLRALERLGEAARDRAPLCRRAAVTGSVGKTSVTQAIAAALKLAGPSHNSVKSYNNHLGVPLTLARMPRETLRAVFEIGMNHANEITPLSGFVRPHVAVVTVVGPVHVENFPDGEAGVARAKAEIFDGLEDGGVAILNADDNWFDLLRAAALARGADVRTFGRAKGSTARLIEFEAGEVGATVVAEVNGRALRFPLAQTGAHWGLNALASILAVEALGAPVETALEALAGFAPLAGRGAETRVQLPAGVITLIDESYNANPISMRAALHTLGVRRARRKIAVLTDMLELGPDSGEVHAALAGPVAEAGVDLLFAAGSDMRSLFDAVPVAHRGGWAKGAAELAPDVVAALQEGDVVMVKGSNGSRASAVVAAIKAAGEGR